MVGARLDEAHTAGAVVIVFTGLTDGESGLFVAVCLIKGAVGVAPELTAGVAEVHTGHPTEKAPVAVFVPFNASIPTHASSRAARRIELTV